MPASEHGGGPPRIAVNVPYRFGRFELNPTTRQMVADGQPLALGARAFDVLLALIERHERVVTKDELLELAWPGVVVEENNLQVQISTLRKTLGSEAIATAPGRGYRFALELSPADKPASPAGAPRHNLPHSLTSFIGHEDDLREYVELLEQTRLLTLTGIGGCGKTRLAIELAERVLPAYADGAWFVDLAPLSEPERLPQTVATALRIRKQVDQPHIESLCEHLARRHMLLVLDNCEHLSAACAELTRQLLGAAPGLRVLVTSREGLGIPGERTVTVRSLALPRAASEHDLASLQASEAVRLFIERAQLAVSKFSFDASTASAVAEICRRLDGIPLAIELAAARLKVLSVEDLRARLNDRFRLLTGGRGTALARQPTLLAAVQWSYDHLVPDDQRLLRLLSVFAGGWTLGGAVRVFGGEADEYEILDRLTRLVDLSLIRVERCEDGATRYTMLETVRQYALEQLNRSGEGDPARTRHLEFFVALAEEAEPPLSGDIHAESLLRIRAELENLLQAVAWCDHASDGAALGLRLVYALGSLWDHLGLMGLGHQVTLTALGRSGAQARDAKRAKALTIGGHLSCSVVRYEEAGALVAEALSITREIDDRSIAVGALRILAYLADQQGDSTSALGLLVEALSLARGLGDKAMVAKVLNGLGEVHRGTGNFEAAQSCYEESLVLARELNTTVTIASICDNLARVLIPLGETGRAREMVQEVLGLSMTSKSKWTALCAFDIISALAAIAGDWPYAARVRGAAEARVLVMKYRRDRTDDAFLAPWTARIREALGDSPYRAAFDSGYALPHEQALAESIEWLERRVET